MKCHKCGSVELKLENKSQLPLMEAPQVALKCAKYKKREVRKNDARKKKKISNNLSDRFTAYDDRKRVCEAVGKISVAQFPKFFEAKVIFWKRSHKKLTEY